LALIDQPHHAQRRDQFGDRSDPHRIGGSGLAARGAVGQALCQDGADRLPVKSDRDAGRTITDCP